MCYGAEIGYGAAIAAALSAAGAGVNAYAQNQQLKKQNDIAAAGLIKQGQIQSQSNADVKSSIKTVAQSNADAQTKSAQQLSAIQKALQQSSAVTNSNAAEPNVPGASKAYAQEQGQASGSAQNYVNAIAKSGATTQGTQLERVGEGEQIAQTAGELGINQSQSNEQNYVTKLQEEATQENPWLKSLGMLLQGAGQVAGAATGNVWASALPGAINTASQAGSTLKGAKGNSVGLGTGMSDGSETNYSSPFGGSTTGGGGGAPMNA